MDWEPCSRRVILQATLNPGIDLSLRAAIRLRHIIQSIAQFDNQSLGRHSRKFAHHILLLTKLFFQFLIVGQFLHQLSHARTESIIQLICRNLTVLHGIVQIGCGGQDFILSKLTDVSSYTMNMSIIGCSPTTGLPLVSNLCKRRGLLNQTTSFHDLMITE